MSNLAKMTLAVDIAMKQKIERDTLNARVSELEAAARLALDVLKSIPTSFGNVAYTKDVQAAIAALKAVL